MNNVRVLQRILKSGAGKFGSVAKITGKYNRMDAIKSGRQPTDIGTVLKPKKLSSILNSEIQRNKAAFKNAQSLNAAEPRKRSKRQAIVILQLAPDAVGAPIFDAFRGDDIGPYDDALFDNNLLSIFPAISSDGGGGSSGTTAVPTVGAPP